MPFAADIQRNLPALPIRSTEYFPTKVPKLSQPFAIYLLIYLLVRHRTELLRDRRNI